METTIQAKTLMNSIENLGSTLNRFEGLSQFSRLMVDKFEELKLQHLLPRQKRIHKKFLAQLISLICIRNVSMFFVMKLKEY